MTSFDARFRVIGQTVFSLAVEVELTGERMTVTAGESQVADWALEEIRIFSIQDGFHIKAEGEEVMINITDNARFATEIGLWDIAPA